MTNLTPQEEQAMIERAKAGDPEANYKMSLWALEQAEAEPGEDRWNRLAAKCLLRAAEAGYGPAMERVGTLLHRPADAAPEGPSRRASQPAPRPDAMEWKPPTESRGTKMMDAVIAFPDKIKGLFAGRTQAQSHQQAQPHKTVPIRKVPKTRPGGKKAGFFNFSQWDDSNWKTMQIVCIVICVILAILITVMIFTGRKTRNREDTQALPTPSTAPAAVTATPEPTIYPTIAIRDEIEGANLEVFPTEEDYVSEPTSSHVNTSDGGLHLRRGPGASYGDITVMDNRTALEVYAYKNSWALVRYNGYIWGWCSTDYLE